MASQDVLSRAFDELAVSALIRCSGCENLLTPPVYTELPNQGVGNICENCFKEKKDDSDFNAFHNRFMEGILEQILVSCPNKKYGCSLKIFYMDMEKHFEACDYSPNKCPLKSDGNCPWSGSSRALIKHFKEDHAKRIVKLDNNYFPVNIPYSTGTYLHLLMTELYAIVLTINVNTETGKMSFSLKNPLSVDPNDYTMKLYGNDPSIFVEYDSKFENAADTKPLHSITLDSLKDILRSTDSIHSLFKFDESCDNPHCKVITTKLLEQLECQSCSDWSAPPFVQCIAGHTICQRCLTKTNICPKCKDQVQVDSKIRNWVLEDLADIIEYTCKYRSNGCTQKFKYDSLKLHQDVCSFQSHNCVFADCTVVLNFEDLKKHLIESHEIDTTDTQKIEFVFKPKKKLSKLCYFKLLYDHIFRIWFKYSENTAYWVVEVLFQQNSNVNFFYEVNTSDDNNPERNFQIQEMCLPPMKDREITYNDGIIIHRSKIETFSLTGRVEIQLKIDIKYTAP